MSVRDLEDLLWFNACALIDRAERLSRMYFVPRLSADRRAAWQPPIDMYETDSEIVIVVALSGVAAEDLEIGLEAGPVGKRQDNTPTEPEQSVARVRNILAQ